MNLTGETNSESSGKVVVGECVSCHRPLKVKASAVRSVMHLTCKCGERTLIQKVEEQDPVSVLIGKGEWEEIAKLGNNATDALVKALRHKDVSVRMKASQSLGSIGDLAAIRPLLQLRDRDSYVEQAAAEALVKLGKPAVPELIAALNTGDSHRAAEVLGHIGDLQAVEPLIDMVKDIYRNRHMAAHALKLLTGQDYGLNADFWEQWWRQNRPF